MNVTVVWATPSVQDLIALDVLPGTTAADAIARSGLAPRYGLDPARMTVAIYGRRVSLQARLEDGDRVEITRPLGSVGDDSSARPARSRSRGKTRP